MKHLLQKEVIQKNLNLYVILNYQDNLQIIIYKNTNTKTMKKIKKRYQKEEKPITKKIKKINQNIKKIMQKKIKKKQQIIKKNIKKKIKKKFLNKKKYIEMTPREN